MKWENYQPRVDCHSIRLHISLLKDTSVVVSLVYYMYIVRFTLNSPTNFHEILHTLFPIHVNDYPENVLINIVEVRPFDM